MNAATNNLWTLEELSAQAALALSVGYAGQENGQVRDVPDPRTIRYYTTLGLVDRPAAMRGRTALYGRRHLLQLMAIKRLQAKGNTLSELQQQLVGLTDTELARIAKLPPPDEETLPERRSANFWMEQPAALEKRGHQGLQSELPLQGVAVGESLTLLLRPARPLEQDDIEAIRSVAGPLLKLLEKRQLL